MARTPLALLSLLALTPLEAFASVGTVSTLEGEASRTPRQSEIAASLAVGSAVELGDTLRVKHGNLKVTLNDESVVVLPEGAVLSVDEAQFQGEERQAVTLRLLAGTVWAAVTQVLEGTGSRFEVQTDRAVAGVRGTIFQVDTATGEAVVSVEEGQVAVRSQAPGAPPEQLIAAQQATRVLHDGRFLRAEFPRRAARFERFLVALRVEHHRILARRRERWRLRQHPLAPRPNERRRRRP